MPYKLLVFDWDGTLMNSQKEIVTCFQLAAKDTNLPIPTEAEVHNVIGLGMFEAVRVLFPDLDSKESQQSLVQHYRQHYFSPEKITSSLFEGVFDMLHKLQNDGYFLTVATGKGRRGLNEVLHITKLKEVFHFTCCVDEAHSKPHPQMLLDTMTYIGVEPEETLMIGDTEYDLQMATNAQVSSVGVCCGAHEKSRLVKHNPLACLDETKELDTWLSR